uniref:Neuronal acetylcholine receptor subunit alpha-7-like n=1 Tax=Gadus morhua TaxID=8049 RepID=A0A8C5B8P2_GADMO
SSPPNAHGSLVLTASLLLVSKQGPHQRNLLRELLRDYNPMERPVANDSNPLIVKFSFILMQVMDVDEKNQILTTNAWLQMQWYDHYLQWNQSEYPGVKNLRFSSDQVWTPDILMYNSAHDKFDASFKTNVLVNSSGFCEFLPPGIFVSTCSVDVTWFPFDIQRCEMKFGSWTFDGWHLDMQMKEADISGFMPNGEWDLLEVPGTRNENFYDCCAAPYPDVTFVVTLRRRTLYYALNLLIPCVLLSSMTLLGFLLPANSGEKISLGITVLLSLTVFMLMVAEIMPATSDSVPLIGQYFVSTMVIVGMSVVATVFVLCFNHHDPNSGDMPKWAQLVLLQWVPWFLRMKRPGETADLPPPIPTHVSSQSKEGGGANGDTPPTLHHHPVPPGFEVATHLPPVSPPFESSICPGGCLEVGGEGSVGGMHAQCCALQPDSVDGQLQALLEEVRYIVEHIREQDRQLSVAEQWQFASAVIDRLCFIGFSVFNVICTISILMAAPNFAEAASKDFL